MSTLLASSRRVQRSGSRASRSATPSTGDRSDSCVAGSDLPRLSASALGRSAAPSHLEAGVPTGSATARWRAKVVRRHACGADQPGGHGVRVPHLARLQLVASPHGRGDSRDEVEQPAGDQRIAGEPARPANRRAEIRNRPATPAADLVAKQAQPAHVAAPDSARANHASTCLVGVGRRRDFDRVVLAVALDDERCVVELGSPPMLASGFDGLEDPAIEADGVTSRAERNPIEIDGCCARCLHCRLEGSQAGCGSASELARKPDVGCPQA